MYYHEWPRADVRPRRVLTGMAVAVLALGATAPAAAPWIADEISSLLNGRLQTNGTLPAILAEHAAEGVNPAGVPTVQPSPAPS